MAALGRFDAGANHRLRGCRWAGMMALAALFAGIAARARRWCVDGAMFAASGRAPVPAPAHTAGSRARTADNGHCASWGAARAFFWFFRPGRWVALFSLPFMAPPQKQLPEPGSARGAGSGVAMAGESVADRKLARFRADPSNAAGPARGALGMVAPTINFFELCRVATCCWRWAETCVAGPVGSGADVALLYRLSGIRGPSTIARSRGEDLPLPARSQRLFPGHRVAAPVPGVPDCP